MKCSSKTDEAKEDFIFQTWKESRRYGTIRSLISTYLIARNKCGRLVETALCLFVKEFHLCLVLVTHLKIVIWALNVFQCVVHGEVGVVKKVSGWHRKHS